MANIPCSNGTLILCNSAPIISDCFLEDINQNLTLEALAILQLLAKWLKSVHRL